MSSREVVEAFFERWRVQDVEMTAALYHEDITYKLHVWSSTLPFGGEWHGIDACREHMYAFLAEFDYLSYVPIVISVGGSAVRAQVRFRLRHRLTGGILEGTRRLVFNVKNGRIMRINGYHDAQLVEVFMRLTAYRMATNQLAEVPRLPPLPRRERQGST